MALESIGDLGTDESRAFLAEARRKGTGRNAMLRWVLELYE